MMRRLILATGGALIVGIAVGAGITALWRGPQSVHECMMQRMKGQPTSMFGIVFEFCQTQQKAAELKDSDIWPGSKEDEWKPVTKSDR